MAANRPRWMPSVAGAIGAFLIREHWINPLDDSFQIGKPNHIIEWTACVIYVSAFAAVCLWPIQKFIYPLLRGCGYLQGNQCCRNQYTLPTEIFGGFMSCMASYLYWCIVRANSVMCPLRAPPPAPTSVKHTASMSVPTPAPMITCPGKKCCVKNSFKCKPSLWINGQRYMASVLTCPDWDHFIKDLPNYILAVATLLLALFLYKYIDERFHIGGGDGGPPPPGPGPGPAPPAPGSSCPNPAPGPSQPASRPPTPAPPVPKPKCDICGCEHLTSVVPWEENGCSDILQDLSNPGEGTRCTETELGGSDDNIEDREDTQLFTSFRNRGGCTSNSSTSGPVSMMQSTPGSTGGSRQTESRNNSPTATPTNISDNDEEHDEEERSESDDSPSHVLNANVTPLRPCPRRRSSMTLSPPVLVREDNTPTIPRRPSLNFGFDLSPSTPRRSQRIASKQQADKEKTP